jgi:hypothetical protein
MKKLLISGFLAVGLTLSFTASPQVGATPLFKFLPLLSGYNVALPNGTNLTIGSSNFLYTTTKGQVVYPYSSTGISSNTVAPDAFQMQTLSADVNGDIAANASVFIYLGNTNWIPVVTTNSVGQYFVAPPGFTNASITTAYAGWPLAAGNGYPNWMYPATTNYYGLYNSSVGTNTVVVTLYKSPSTSPSGGIGPNLGPTPTFANQMWESTSTFSFSLNYNTTNGTVVGFSTNLPTAWLTGAKHVYASILNLGTNSVGVLINQLGISQPQP